jgi:transmembrane sensor
MTSQSDTPLLGDAAANRAAHDAARWLAVLSDERCSDAEREAFMQWLRSSTQHVDEFLRLSTIARRASKRSLWPDDGAEALVAAARAAANVAPLGNRTEPPPATTRRTPLARAIAASLALAVGAGAYFAKPQIDALRAPTYATAVGEQRSIALEDGSIIQLNSRSQVRAHYARSLRAIELVEGEAIFRVAKDPSRPFRVRTGGADVVAVGTAFNVNASDARTIVTVLEGRVRVERRRQSAARSMAAIELAIGEQLIVSPTAPPEKLELRDTDKVTSWTERRLIFENTPIGAAALEFARYSPRAIRIEDPQLAARKINGVFEATDPASLVDFLAKTDRAIEVRAEGDGWTVSSRAEGISD